MLGGEDPEALGAARRIQQYTGPVMAKGLEDTALYRFNRLIALSDVGEKPDRFSQSVASFHDFLKSRLDRQRHGMLTSSSHDTKRGEDIRARLASLSGHARVWDRKVDLWAEILLGQGAPAIDRGDLSYFFQTLLGAWPVEIEPDEALDEPRRAAFQDRIGAAMLKSVREARQRTNWNVPRHDYEAQLDAFIKVAMGSGANPFLDDFRQFEATIAWDGACNGLVETLIKLTAPGVPDIYQGSELWEQSMVDPDNRRPVDFGARAALLAQLQDDAPLAPLSRHFRDGAIKLALIRRVLALRRRHAGLFADGDYQPLEVAGADAKRVLAFTRTQGEVTLLVAATLRPWLRTPAATALPPCPIAGAAWRDVLQNTAASDGLCSAELPISLFIAERP
ncbi:MAG: DUF3459 domain-containing protein [Alphaproteobacteria bacterium]|nr:MAG: DUF3459 domain-containing protein [Alphaproteobacteria bacterium]